MMTIKILNNNELNEVSGAGKNGRDDGRVGIGKNSSTSYGGQGGGFVGTHSNGLSLGNLSRLQNNCFNGIVGGAMAGSLGGPAGAAIGAMGGAVGGGCFKQ